MSWIVLTNVNGSDTLVNSDDILIVVEMSKECVTRVQFRDETMMDIEESPRGVKNLIRESK